MKAYVIPVENYCNAKCHFCITKFKEESQFGGLIDPEKVGLLRDLNIDAIEISGGGEPLMHPQIDRIIRESAEMKPTTVYTNALLLKRLPDSTLPLMTKLTVSRHHHDKSINNQIMGITYEDDLLRGAIEKGAKLRLTAVLCKKGMSSGKDVLGFLNWAKELGVKMVQIRQFFDYEYGELRSEFVRTEPVLQGLLKLRSDLSVTEEKYKTVDFDGIKVEFEGDKCACDVGGPNLRGNGNIYWGWTEKLYEPTAA